jgi:hypothetical protein
MRGADYDDTAALREDLYKLREEYPMLEVRGMEAKKDIMLQVIRSRAISNYRGDLGHLTAGAVVEALRTSVPSLAEDQHITATWVDTQLDPHTNAVFVTIVPTAMDILKLCRERHRSYRTIENQAASRRLGWPRPLPDLTVAYVPQGEPPSAISDAVAIAESHLPLPVTLLPAL